jgi:Tol biopolymer transport system component
MAILQTKTFFGPGTLAVAPLGGGAPREVLENAMGTADWSPDGRSLAVLHRAEGKVRLEFPIGHALLETNGHTLRLDGSLRAVASVPGVYVMHDRSPDGRVLVERSTSTSMMRAGGVDGRERDLGWLDEFGATGLSSDGKTLLFRVFGAGGGAHGAVYIRGTDGSAPKRIATGNARALSPDGKWALCDGDGGAPPLRLVPTGAGQVRILEPGDITRYGPGGFHPDGASVWFNAVEPGHPARCYVQSVAGGPPRPLPAGSSGVRAISPDGSVLAVGDDSTERPQFVTARPERAGPYPEASRVRRRSAGAVTAVRSTSARLACRSLSRGSTSRTAVARR